MADNPFEEKGAANPFAEPGARGGARGGEDLHNPFEKPAAAPPSPAASVPADGSAYESAPAPTSTFGAYDTGAYGGSSGAYADPPASAAPSAFNSPSLSGGGEASIRVRELDQRERVLDERERELARREAELLANGGPRKKNYPFPGFFVFTYHSIDNEIPEEKRRALRMAHYSFILIVVALCWNFLSATAAAIKFTAVSGWFMSVIYLGAGVPLAWTLWYRRVYSACKHDSALGFMWFFLIYIVHIGFCLYAFIGIDAAAYSLTGLGNWGKANNKSPPIGVMYLVGTFLFGTDIIISVNAIRMMYAVFRGAGHTFKEAQEQAKRDAARSAAQNAT